MVVQISGNINNINSKSVPLPLRIMNQWKLSHLIYIHDAGQTIPANIDSQFSLPMYASLDFPKGVKPFLKGVNSPSLAVQLAPL